MTSSCLPPVLVSSIIGQVWWQQVITGAPWRRPKGDWTVQIAQGLQKSTFSQLSLNPPTSESSAPDMATWICWASRSWMEVGNLPALASALGKFCHPSLPTQTLVILFMHVVSSARSIGSPKASVERPALGAQKSRPAVEKFGVNLGTCWVHQHVSILGRPILV